MIRVIVADDHAIVREGLRRIISETKDVTVAGEAASGPDLLSRVGQGKFDVVVMDLAMPGLPGLEVLEEIRKRRPQVPVVVFSMHPESQYAVRTIMAGAAGYVHKSKPPDELLKAIRTVARGRRYIDPDVAESLASHIDAVSAKPGHKALSNREYQVMCLIASGKTASEIARDLRLSVKTVSTFRGRILDKLELRHNADIMRYALDHGLVQ